MDATFFLIALLFIVGWLALGIWIALMTTDKSWHKAWRCGNCGYTSQWNYNFWDNPCQKCGTLSTRTPVFQRFTGLRYITKELDDE